jgi:hypothetical protein
MMNMGVFPVCEHPELLADVRYMDELGISSGQWE